MPSTRSLDRGSPPNAAGPVERQNLTRPTSRRLLHCEMALENDLLGMCHAVFSGIQKVAAGLHKSETRISEQRPKTEPQEIGGWDIIRVEHRDKRLVGAGESGGQRPGFEAGTVRALDESDIVAPPAELGNRRPGYFSARIGAVVEQLYLQPITRPIQRYRRINGTPHKVTFVEGGNLNKNGGKFILGRKRLGKRNPFSLEPGAAGPEVEQHPLGNGGTPTPIASRGLRPGICRPFGRQCQGMRASSSSRRDIRQLGHGRRVRARMQLGEIQSRARANHPEPLQRAIAAPLPWPEFLNHNLDRRRTATARAIASDQLVTTGCPPMQL